MRGLNIGSRRTIGSVRADLLARTFGALAIFALLCVPRAVAASSTFPPHLKSYWPMKAKLPGNSADGCPLCHTTDPGQSGSATQKFALRLRNKYQLAAGDVGSLEAALKQDKLDNGDSDGDGISDYDEIVTDGTNPNDPKDHRVVVTMMPPPTSSQGGAGGTPDDGDGGGEAPIGGAGPTVPTECTPSETIYPSLGYGCGLPRSSGRPDLIWILGLAAAYFARRRAQRARRSRRI